MQLFFCYIIQYRTLLIYFSDSIIPLLIITEIIQRATANKGLSDDTCNIVLFNVKAVELVGHLSSMNEEILQTKQKKNGIHLEEERKEDFKIYVSKKYQME